MVIVEEKMKKCKSCGGITPHFRNNKKSSGFMLLVHFFLTIGTGGLWLIMAVLWKILTTKFGGWRCSECGKKGAIW